MIKVVKTDYSPAGHMKRFNAYQKNRNDWFDQRIEEGEVESKVESERTVFNTNFEQYLDKMRKLEVIV
jgi:hypothetical protein